MLLLVLVGIIVGIDGCNDVVGFCFWWCVGVDVVVEGRVIIVDGRVVVIADGCGNIVGSWVVVRG